MRMNDQQDTSMVVRKPSRFSVDTRRTASPGREAMEWTTKSSSPQSFACARTPLHLSRRAHVEWQQDRCVELARQRLDIFLALSLR